ncbi:MAG: hypothetical protein F4X77_07855 [Acidobacteriia bacterium]|nr:hypothetical protein [Terriglobia bacterium]
MSETTSSSTELSRVASPLAEAAAPEPDAVEYPDRLWTAPSFWHGEAVWLATRALHRHFSDHDDVLVAMELVVYYERGNNRAWLQPDLQVVFGVVDPHANRYTFKVWEEGTAPDFVLEVASPSTAEHNAQYQARQYAAIGVREYWRLDPTGELTGTPLEGYRARGSRSDRVASVTGPGGAEYLHSAVLGLDLSTARRNGPTVLVTRDPRTGEECDGRVQKYYRQRRIAEARMSAADEELSAIQAEIGAARERTRIAEERARVLEQRLRELTGQAGPMGRDSKG